MLRIVSHHFNIGASNTSKKKKKGKMNNYIWYIRRKNLRKSVL